MKTTIKKLGKLSLVCIVCLSTVHFSIAQDQMISLEKKAAESKRAETEKEIAEALQAYVNALKLHQIKAVLEFNINEDVRGWGIGGAETSDVKGWGIGESDQTDIKGWGIGESDQTDIKGWGIGESDQTDIKGWGSMPRSDVENILKARTIDQILGASNSEILGYARPSNTDNSERKKDRTMKNEEDKTMGFTNTKSADELEFDDDYFGFVSEPSREDLTLKAELSKAKIKRIKETLSAVQLDGDSFSTKNPKCGCETTKCLIRCLSRISSMK